MKFNARRLATTLFTIWAATWATEAQAGTLRLHSLQHDGVTRYYRVYTPDTYDEATATPVILVFHGYGGNAMGMTEGLGFTELADREGLLCVFPEGSGTLAFPPFFLFESWNAGRCCGYASIFNVDDVGFVDRMLDALGDGWNVDESRIYATGFSNGGMLAYRLAGELGHRFAAIAPVAGAVVRNNLAPTETMPIIAFHGGEDCTVPPGELNCSGDPNSYDSQKKSLAPFFLRNGCTLPSGGEPTEVRGTSNLYIASAPDSGADIFHWFTSDVDHVWMAGYNGVDCTTEMWRFFQNHARN